MKGNLLRATSRWPTYFFIRCVASQKSVGAELLMNTYHHPMMFESCSLMMIEVIPMLAIKDSPKYGYKQKG